MFDLTATRWATFWRLPRVGHAVGFGGLAWQLFWLSAAILFYLLAWFGLASSLLALGVTGAALYWFWRLRMTATSLMARDRRQLCIPGGESRLIGELVGWVALTVGAPGAALIALGLGVSLVSATLVAAALAGLAMSWLPRNLGVFVFLALGLPALAPSLHWHGPRAALWLGTADVVLLCVYAFYWRLIALGRTSWRFGCPNILRETGQASNESDRFVFRPPAHRRRIDGDPLVIALGPEFMSPLAIRPLTFALFVLASVLVFAVFIVCLDESQSPSALLAKVTSGTGLDDWMILAFGLLFIGASPLSCLQTLRHRWRAPAKS